MTDLAQLLDAICLSVQRDGIAFAATARERTKPMNLEWYVYYYDINSSQLKTFNIFNHRGFKNAIEEIFKKYYSMEEFKKAVKSELMYYFWSKAEWEIVISDWFGKQVEKKIDVYDQVMLNWDRFIEWLYHELYYKFSYKED